jgi:integrase
VATAFHAGLRRGELVAPQIKDVNLRRSCCASVGWDRVEGEIERKSTHARREIPISNALRRFLVEHLIDFVFPRGVAALRVDREADRCDHWEPNVWMRHRGRGVRANGR